MKQKTKEILDELYQLNSNCNSMIWDYDKQGEFDIVKFMESRDILEKTDLESVVKNWQSMENRGMLLADYLDYYKDKYDYLDTEEQQNRKKIYQYLVEQLQFNLKELQVYLIEFDLPEAEENTHFLDYFGVSNLPDCIYCSGLIIGKTNDDQWLSIFATYPCHPFLPTVDESPVVIPKKTQDCISTFEVKIEKILQTLSPITIDVDGQSYQHQILCYSSIDRQKTVETILSRSHWLSLEGVEILEGDISFYFDEINIEVAMFLDNNCRNIKIYNFTFWDETLCVFVGQLETSDYLILSNYKSEFNIYKYLQS